MWHIVPSVCNNSSKYSICSICFHLQRCFNSAYCCQRYGRLLNQSRGDVVREDTTSLDEREAAFSPESTAYSMGVLSAFRGRGADLRRSFGASSRLKVREEKGRHSPPQIVTATRLRSMVIGRCDPDYFQVCLEKIARYIVYNRLLN